MRRLLLIIAVLSTVALVNTQTVRANEPAATMLFNVVGETGDVQYERVVSRFEGRVTLLTIHDGLTPDGHYNGVWSTVRVTSVTEGELTDTLEAAGDALLSVTPCYTVYAPLVAR